MKKLKQPSKTNRIVRRLISHATLILSVIILVCFVIDRFNGAMEFMTSEITKWLIAALALLAGTNGVLTIVALWENPSNMR